MRIFERLRGRHRSERSVELRLVGTIVGDLLRRIDDETPVTAVSDRTEGALRALRSGGAGTGGTLPDMSTSRTT
jgi:hypothetical protein